MNRPLVIGALAAVLVLATVGCGDDDGEEVATTGTTEPVTSMTAGAAAMTVAEATGLAEGTEVTVRAFVFQPDEGATVLCDTFGESYPPQCVGATLVTNGLDVNALPGLESSAGADAVAPATWTAQPVEVTGTLANGALQVG